MNTLETLQAEVKHCEQRLELARQQLREWRLSHQDPEFTSIYEKQGLREVRWMP